MTRTARRVALGVLLAMAALAPRPVHADGVAPSQATKEQAESAQKSFLAGDELYDKKRYEDALKLYRESFEIVASPNSRLMIARCLRELGRLEEAYPAFEAALGVAKAAAAKEDKYLQTQKAAEEELAQLRQRLGRLEIRLVGEGADSSKVTVAGKSYEAAQLKDPVIVAPGNVSISATKPDGKEVTKDVAVSAGATLPVEINLSEKAVEPVAPLPKEPPPVADEPDSPPDPSLRMWAYVAGGVGVAGLAAFTVFGVMNNSKYNSLEDDCPDGRCPADRQSDIDSGKRFQTFANVGLAVGILGLGSGVALYLVSGSSPEKRAKKRPSIALGPGSVTFGGRF